MNRSLILRTLRRCWILPALVALSLGFGACSEEPVTPPTPVSKTVTGTVESPDGNQLVEAVIEAVDADGTTVIARDTTDETGNFALPEQVTASDISLRVMHPEFPTQILGAATLVRNAGGKTGIRILMDAEDSCCGVVTVIVRDSSNNPVSNAQVRLRRGSNGGRTGTTGDNGTVVFRNVCEGEFNIRIARDGYRVLERGDIMVNDCDSVTVQTTLSRSSNTGGGNTGGDDTCCNGIYRIFPTDSNGNAINGVSVRITRAGTTNSRTLSSGDNGQGAIFRELCRGTWNVRLARDGYGVVEFSITVGCNDSNSTDRVMRPNSGGNTGGGDDTCCNGVIRILPTDSTGAAINGVSVRITRANTTTVRTGTTNDGRALIFRELCAGTWNVRLARDGYSVVEYSITLTCNDSVSSDRRMNRTGGGNTGGDDTCCRGILRIFPVDSNGNAINGVTVRIIRSGTTTSRTLSTGDDGRGAIFREVCSGTWNVRLSRDGYGVVEYSVTATCNDSVSSDRRMNANAANNCCSGVLRLRVRDSLPASGDGWLSGATVTLTEGNTTIVTGTTNGEGNWGREQLCSGHTYTARISKDGYVTKTVSFTFNECNTKQETIALRRE